MFRKNISIHSDALGNLPYDLIFPLINHCGFHRFDLSEQFILNCLQKHTQNSGLLNFNGFSDINLTSDEISSLAKILIDILFRFNSQNSTIYHSPLNSLISDPKHLHLNDIDFQLSLDKYWSKLLTFLYKLESKYIMIEIPGINLNQIKINDPSLYNEKYYQKLQARFQTLAKLSDKNDIELLVNYNPNRFIRNDSNEGLTYHFPFNTFQKFRSFYNGLLENEENFGLFLDMSDYFLLKTPELIQNLIQLDEIQEKKDPLNPLKINEMLVRLGHSNDNLFADIHNIEHLSMLGLNDLKIVEIWSKILETLINNDKVQLYKKTDLSIPQINHIFMNILIRDQFSIPQLKRYLGWGDLPVQTFLSQIHSHTSRTNKIISYSINPTLKIDKPDLSSVDWRDLDINKIPFKSDVFQSVQQHIKNTTSSQFLEKNEEISSWKKHQLHLSHTNLEIDEQNMLNPPNDIIENMNIFSMKTIFDGIKRYHSFL